MDKWTDEQTNLCIELLYALCVTSNVNINVKFCAHIDSQMFLEFDLILRYEPMNLNNHKTIKE